MSEGEVTERIKYIVVVKDMAGRDVVVIKLLQGRGFRGGLHLRGNLVRATGN